MTDSDALLGRRTRSIYHPSLDAPATPNRNDERNRLISQSAGSQEHHALKPLRHGEVYTRVQADGAKSWQDTVSGKLAPARPVFHPIAKVLVLWTFFRTFGQVGQMIRVVINEQQHVF